jgi:glycerol uptake facilitator-like aquaporin
MARIAGSRRLAAEAIGTAFLVATVVGSGIMAERLADGNDAIALLGNTLATGAMLVVLITVLGPVSGAHFNPAVTLAFLIRREIGAAIALAYIASQIAGGIAGTWLAHAMFEEPLVQFSTRIRTGPAQWLAEGVASFGLMATILGTLRYRPDGVAWMVGLYIAAAYWFTASTSFANPAVTIARSLTDSFSGIRPSDAPGFIAAQLVGAAAATIAMGWLLGPAALARPAPAPHREAAAE